MIKKWLNKLINKFWRKQDKKLNELQSAVENLEKQLEEQKKKTNNLRNFVKKELEKRDQWEMRSAEIKFLAKGKKIWVIKCPAPDTADKILWGPHNFSVALKRELEAKGYYVVIDYHNNWAGRIDADYVLVLRGLHTYRPDRRCENCKYILWHNCYPDQVTKEEYELYDLVVVNSFSYTKKLEEELSVPVKTLLLCADVTKFFPREEEIKYDKVFVGNTRKVHRNIVTWCEEHKIPIQVWGRMDGPTGWKNYVKKDTCIKLESPMPNDELPNLYRASKIILNDHFDEMREYGFVNNRVMEALSCGRPVLSDYSEEYEELFGDSLVYYYDEDDFLKKLKWLEEHLEEQTEKVLAVWPKLQKEFSFEARVDALLEMVEEI